MKIEAKERKILRKLAVVDEVLTSIYGEKHVQIYKVCIDDAYWCGESVDIGYRISVETFDGTVHTICYDNYDILRQSVDDILNDVADIIIGAAQAKVGRKK